MYKSWKVLETVSSHLKQNSVRNQVRPGLFWIRFPWSSLYCNFLGSFLVLQALYFGGSLTLPLPFFHPLIAPEISRCFWDCYVSLYRMLSSNLQTVCLQATLKLQSCFLLYLYHQETAVFSRTISFLIMLMGLHVSTKFLGYHSIPGQKVAHTPRPRWWYSNLANHVPAGLWKLCLWEGVCFWCPLKYSNWEILGSLIWSCNSGWGQLNLGRIGRLLSGGVDSMKEGESLLFMSLGSHLICHSTTPTIWYFLAGQDAFCSQCIWKCATIKDVKWECWIMGLKEGASLEKAWTEEGAEFHQSDLIGLSLITSNWANGHWGLSDWVAAGSSFLSFRFS